VISLAEAVDQLGVEVPRSKQIMCPTGHDRKSPSFQLYYDTDSFFCFGCGASGDVPGFIALWTGRPIGSVLREYGDGFGRALSTVGKNPQMVREHVEMQRILLTQPAFDAIRLSGLPVWVRDWLIDEFDRCFDEWWSGLEDEPPVKQERALRDLPLEIERFLDAWEVRQVQVP